MVRSFYKNTISNVMKIFITLKKASDEGEMMTISKIAAATGIHKWSVSRTIDLYMSPFVEVIIPEHLEEVGLNLKIVRLKDENVTMERIANYLKTKKMMTEEINP
ncbi:MAG: hypothetical protein GXO64_01935 [Candidatus Micrarchaeota archaeon]|nr:hypothetical protein [Candidatus Micrarchaeota archaeon]